MQAAHLRPAAWFAALAAAALCVAVPPPLRAGGDPGEAAFKEIEISYKKLAKNRDDAANRQRRKLLLQCFDFRTQKSCKKLLRDAYDDEPTADNRIAIVQVLAATGDPKDLDFLISSFRKEKASGPVLAIAAGLSFTAPEDAAVVAPHAVGVAAKQKGDAVRALLEGAGLLAEPAAAAPLAALAGKLQPHDEFERIVALGACARDGAMNTLERTAVSTDPTFRFAAALGLGLTGGPEKPPVSAALPMLRALVGDKDPRVVEAAAAALGRAKDKDALGQLSAALRSARLRTREVVRAALREITGRDAGHDADLWLKDGGTAPSPVKLPQFSTIPVPSDRVALVLDLSRSMDWNARLERAKDLLRQYLAALPDDAVFGVIAAGRTPFVLSDRLGSGAAAKQQADQFLAERTTASWCDLREALTYVVTMWPDVDTIVLATDSAPSGEAPEDSPYEVAFDFRRDTRIRPVRVHVAFTAPGGRYPESEVDEHEYPYRKDVLKEFAELTGGTFVAVE